MRSFKVTRVDNRVRFDNYCDFIKEKFQYGPDKQTNCLVVLVTFNNSAELIELLDKMVLDHGFSQIELLIIDNHSSDEHLQKLQSHLKSLLLQSAVYLRVLTDNLGGGGGYAVALECFLQEYPRDYLLITEDDAMPLTDNIIQDMLVSAQPNREVVIKFKELNCHSFSFHYHLYPKNLIIAAGVPDPRFFMRRDDLEFAYRCNAASRKLSISLHSLDHYYQHPIFKRFGNNAMMDYFEVRNMNEAVCCADKFIQQLIRIVFIENFFQLWRGFAVLLIDGQKSYLLLTFLALRDFIFCRFGFQRNQSILRNRSTFNVVLPRKIFESEELNFLKDKKVISKRISTLAADLRLQPTNLSFDEVICNQYFSITYPIHIISKRLWVLEVLEKDSKGYVWQASLKDNQLTRILFSLFSGLLAFILFILLLPMILCRVTINRFKKKKGYK